MIWISHIKESNLNEEIPVDIVNSSHDMIQDTSAASSVEQLRLQVEEISQEIFDDRSITNQLWSMVFNLQDKLDEVPWRNPASSPMGSREDLFHQDGNVQESNAIASEATNLERDIVRKGIEGCKNRFLN